MLEEAESLLAGRKLPVRLHAMLGGAWNDILSIMFGLFLVPLYFTDRFPKVHIK